jgi:hypothetical protein
LAELEEEKVRFKRALEERDKLSSDSIASLSDIVRDLKLRIDRMEKSKS